MYTGDTTQWPPGLYIAEAWNGPVKVIVQTGKPTFFKKPNDPEWRRAYNNFLGLTYKKIADL